MVLSGTLDALIAASMGSHAGTPAAGGAAGSSRGGTLASLALLTSASALEGVHTRAAISNKPSAAHMSLMASGASDAAISKLAGRVGYV